MFVSLVAYGDEERARFWNEARLGPALPVPVPEMLEPSASARCVEVLTINHEPLNGVSTVISATWLSDPDRGAADDEVFEHLTFQIPTERIGEVIEIPSPDVDTRYSAGNLSAALFCAGEVGSSPSGTVTTKLVGTQIAVTANLEFRMYHAAFDWFRGTHLVRREFQADEGADGEWVSPLANVYRMWGFGVPDHR